MAAGRPLRFMVAIMAGWAGVRAIMLWPGTAIPVPAKPEGPAKHMAIAAVNTGIIDIARDAGAAPAQKPGSQPVHRAWPMAQPSARWPDSRRSMAGETALPPAGNPRVALAMLDMVRFGRPPMMPGGRLAPGLPDDRNPVLPASQPGDASRLSGAFWLALRGGDRAVAGLTAGQLGGSQAGLRGVWTISTRRRLALSARVTTPVGTEGAEAALALEWQPTRLPVRLVAEMRGGLNGVAPGSTRLAPAIGLVGGIGPRALRLPVISPAIGPMAIEAYGQAGVIDRGGVLVRYGDAAARLSRPVLDRSGWQVTAGIGAWGGAQDVPTMSGAVSGAARLDIGPSLAVTMPLGKRAARLSADWRQRIAGNARPGSGPAVTLSADF